MDLSALFWNYELSISITGDVLRCFLFLFMYELNIKFSPLITLKRHLNI